MTLLDRIVVLLGIFQIRDDDNDPPDRQLRKSFYNRSVCEALWLQSQSLAMRRHGMGQHISISKSQNPKRRYKCDV
jgi:hypothetical protein